MFDADETTKTRPAHVLVVDDSGVNRTKMRLAVRALGHKVETAEDGSKALKLLSREAYDAVLLDIVMPEIDGFDVLATMKADPALRDVPVIVVSALDDETESVVKAIELGAEDFLPKNFDPVLLNARLEASLNKKRYRDQEREYFRGVERLTEAAEVLESGRFSPDALELDGLDQRGDALGRLAAVFRGMAEEIYDREKRLRRAVQTLQGSLLVIAVGVAWGLTPALARMASGLGAEPIGLGVWVNGIAALMCLSIAAWRGKLPRLTFRELGFFLGWAVIAGVLQRLTTFWVTGYVEAAMLSLIVTLQGFMVFAFAAVTRMEAPSPRRLLGLLVGLIGVVAVLYTRFDDAAKAEGIWLAIALILPLLFAVEAVYLAARRPVHVDLFASVGLMMGFSAVFLAVMAAATGGFMPLGPEIGRLELITVLMGVVGATSVLLAFHLIAAAGAVFASQSAYAMTIAGIVWGMLLLNEEVSVVAWIAIGVILLGLYLVEPKPSDDEIVVNRSFVRSKGANGKFADQK